MKSDAPESTSVEIHLRCETDEGPLEVRARRMDDRWLVEARCNDWRQVGVGAELASAADAALHPYAGGQPLPMAMRRPRGKTQP